MSEQPSEQHQDLAPRGFPVRLVLVAAGVVVLLALLAGAAVRSFEVLAEGQLLSYTEGKIYQVEVLGVPLYLEPEVRPSSDVVISGMLTAVAGMATLAWLVYQMTGSGSRAERRFHALVAGGAIYLAADELMGIHESIGHNLQWLTRIPGIDRPDDAVIIAYAVLAAAFLLWHVRLLRWSKPALWMWIAAAGVFGVAAVLDAIGAQGEEVLEVVAAILIAVGFGVFAADGLRGAIIARHTGRVTEALRGMDPIDE